MTEEDYQRLVVAHSGTPAKRMHPLAYALRILLWSSFGVGLLFVPVLSGFGVLVLLVVTGVVFRASLWRGLKRFSGDPHRASTPYIVEPVRSGADQDGFWLESSKYQFRMAWPALYIWELRHGWLRLAAEAVPQVFLPVNAMVDAKVFDAIMSQVRAHGAEYDTPAAAHRAFRRRAV